MVASLWPSNDIHPAPKCVLPAVRGAQGGDAGDEELAADLRKAVLSKRLQTTTCSGSSPGQHRVNGRVAGRVRHMQLLTDLGECRKRGLPAPSAHERRIGVLCYRPQGAQTLLIKAGVIFVKVFPPTGPDGGRACQKQCAPGLDRQAARAGSPTLPTTSPCQRPHPAALTALLRAWSWSHWSHNRPPASGKRASNATKRVLSAEGGRGHAPAGRQGVHMHTGAR